MNIKEQLNNIGIKIGKFADILGISRQTLDTYINLFENGQKLPNSEIENTFSLLFIPDLKSLQDFSERLSKIKKNNFAIFQKSQTFNNININSFGFITNNSEHNNHNNSKISNEPMYDEPIPRETIGNLTYNDKINKCGYYIKLKELLSYLKDKKIRIDLKDKYFEQYVKETPYYFVEKFYKEYDLETYLDGYVFENQLLYNKRNHRLLKCAELLIERNVIIPDDVEVICDEAFANNSVIEGVSIPKNIKRIGDHAFFNCPKLEVVVFEAQKQDVCIAMGITRSLSIGYRIFELSSIIGILVHYKNYVDYIYYEIYDDSKYKGISFNCFFENNALLYWLHSKVLSDKKIYDTLVVTKDNIKMKLMQYYNCGSIKQIICDAQTPEIFYPISIWDFIKVK